VHTQTKNPSLILNPICTVDSQHSIVLAAVFHKIFSPFNSVSLRMFLAAARRTAYLAKPATKMRKLS